MAANDLPINTSYASWAPDSRFRLVNVPWDSGYRNVVEFTSSQAQHDYFDSLSGLQVTKASMQRYGVPVRVDVPFNQASLYNYLVVKQPYGFDTTKTYYYFVTDCVQVNAHVTQLNVYLDVWQTYLFDRTWGQAYVERGHIGVANENQMRNRGRTYLDIPEGLDCGSDYRVVEERHQHFMARQQHPEEGYPDMTQWSLLILSTTSLAVDPGTVDNPKLVCASGSTISGIPNGVEVYCLEHLDQLDRFWQAIQTYSWAAQGIIGLWLIPLNIVKRSRYSFRKLFGKNDGVDLIQPDELQRRYQFINAKQFLTKEALGIPDRYRHLKKFQMYPYCAIEVSMTNGSSVILKPQYMASDDLTVDLYEWYGAPSPRLWLMPRDFNGGEGFNITIGIDDLPRLLGVTNSAQAWLASNANSIRAQRQSAEWSQNKTQMGINNAYAQANESAALQSRSTARANALSSNMTALGNAQRSNETLLNVAQMQFDTAWADANSGFGLGMGVASGAASGGLGGAIGAAASGGTQAIAGYTERHSRLDQAIGQANARTGLANDAAATAQSLQAAASTAQTDDATGLQRRFADQNRALGTAVAQGDYANAIAGINARVQDAQLTPPSTVGTTGGEAALIAGDELMAQIRLRRINSAALYNIGEVWLRYGYYVQRYMQLPGRLTCMSHFAYWKCQDVELVRGAMPEEFRLTLKGILEKGVTVWADPNIIATCDKADNDPVPGYSY